VGFLRRLVSGRRLDAELDRELRFHVEEETRRLSREFAPEEARRRALAAFGGFDPMREATRDARGVGWLEDFGKDLTLAARMIRRNPGFAATAILSVALGVGANAAIFSVTDALLRRPLPITRPEELHFLSLTADGQPAARFSGPAFQHLQAAVPEARLVAMTEPNRVQATLDNTARLIQGQLVTGNWFSMLGVGASVGRVLTPDDDRHAASGAEVVVLSHAFWDRTFGRNPAVVGTPLIINGEHLTIVGVADEAFTGLGVGETVDVWLPVSLQHQIRYRSNADINGGDRSQPWFSQTGISWLELAVRIPSATAASVTSRLLAVTRAEVERAAAEEKDAIARADILRMQPLLVAGATGQSSLRDRFSRSLVVLAVTVALVMLIACANLASLLLARSSARAREFALRASIGARRGRLVRQMLTESLLLASVGGVLGLAVAWWGAHALLRLASSTSTPIPLAIVLDWRVVAFALAASVGTGLLFGLGPAVRLSRTDVRDALRPGTRVVGSHSASPWSLGRLLVIGQVALSLALLIGALLFVRTFDNLLSSDLGFDRSAVLGARFDATLANVPTTEWPAMRQRLTEAAQAVPGVTSVALALNGPLSNGVRTSNIQVEGQPALPARESEIREEYITPGYFTTIGTTRLAGRDFTGADDDHHPLVAVISEAMAKRFFGGENPIGKRFGYDAKATTEIVGVVRDALMDGANEHAPVAAFYPLAQYPTESVRHVYVRTESGAVAATVPAALRAAIQRAEPRLAVSDVATLEELSRRGLSNSRMVSQLTTAFGLVAVLVACLGLYGTLSYAVSRRTKELGVRLALGSAPLAVCWIVLRDALWLVAIGCAAGLAVAWLGLKSITSLLWGLSPRDPATFGLATAAFLLVAGVAAAIPAIRASRVDPLTALRTE
jgi:predicted permease